MNAVSDTNPERDKEGYLVEPSQWHKDLAIVLASEEDIVLTGEHWIVINYIREFFDDNQVVPDVRHAFKHLASELKVDKKEGKKLLFKLFPYGYVKQTCKIAGMKRPRAWSTG